MNPYKASEEKGIFIVIEGIDGSGKSQLIEGLKKKFDENMDYRDKVVFIRSPGGSDFAERYRDACLNEDTSLVTQMLFYGALLNHTAERVIKPLLRQGKVVICDRWYTSLAAYQGVISSNLELCRDIAFLSGVQPSLNLYLSLPLETAMSRNHGGDRYSTMDLEYKQKVKEVYDRLHQFPVETTYYGPATSFLLEDFHRFNKSSMAVGAPCIIDATQTVQEVLEDSYEEIIDHIEYAFKMKAKQ